MNARHAYSSALLFCALLAGLTSSGCATAYSRAHYLSTGEYNPKGNEEVEKNYRKLQEAPPPEAAKVKVMLESVPEGIKYDHNVVSVEKGYPIKILGKFHLFGPGTSFRFADYKSTGHKALCYPQVPLIWLTLGAWALVPSFYPCFVRSISSQEEWIDHLRLLAVAAKGNLVVVERDGHGFAKGFIFAADPEYLESMSKPSEKKEPKQQEAKAPRSPEV